MFNWKIEEKLLPLKFDWKISRNTSVEKKNFFITVSDGQYTGIGEIAPNVRYGENEDLIRQQFNTFIDTIPENFLSSEVPGDFIGSLELCHSLRFGIESAYIHFLCNKNNITPAEYFNVNLPQKVFTSFSLPILETHLIKDFIAPLERFKTLKIKVNQEQALEIINEVVKYTDKPLRIDGNESWTDVNLLINFIDKIKAYNIEFIEQPMPSHLVDEYIFLKPKCPFDLIADESVEDEADFQLIKKQFDGVNMKLMKAGGYINGLRILNEARKNGLKTMIGCMIETSLGIYSAYNLADNVDYLDLDGFLIIRDDPFKLVKEEDGFLYL